MRHLLLFPLALSILTGTVIAGEPKVLFEDSFDKKLGDGWTWLREDKDTWRVKDGALEICVEPGKAHNVKNALLRKSPDRSKKKFAVEVTVAFTSDPTEQWEQAGITWYHANKPVFKLVHERIDGDLWIIPGKKPAPKKTVQLRLIVDGKKWTAQFREDLKAEFQTVAEGELPPPGNDMISLQCYNGPTEGKHWFQFDNFRILELDK